MKPWYAETNNRATGQLLQRTPPTSYDETYTLEFIDNGWIVSHNGLV
jgi:hypothetical protein